MTMTLNEADLACIARDAWNDAEYNADLKRANKK